MCTTFLRSSSILAIDICGSLIQTSIIASKRFISIISIEKVAVKWLNSCTLRVSSKERRIPFERYVYKHVNHHFSTMSVGIYEEIHIQNQRTVVVRFLVSI
jgi:hypothetical protein